MLYLRLACLLLISISCISCEEHGPSAAPETHTSPPSIETGRTIEVSTTDEFLDAIGSDRTILLAPGMYDIDETRVRDGRYYTNQGHYLSGEPVVAFACIRNVKNLRIMGTEEGRSSIYTSDPQQAVLLFQNVDNVELVNLELGHLPAVGGNDCEDEVLGFSDASNVVIRNCLLYGTGTHGLILQDVKGLFLLDSIIMDCTEGILSAYGCETLVFRNSRFVWNDRSGLDFSDCSRILFEDCSIEDNRMGEQVFLVEKSSRVVFRRGTIQRNHSRHEPPSLSKGGVDFLGTVISMNEDEAYTKWGTTVVERPYYSGLTHATIPVFPVPGKNDLPPVIFADVSDVSIIRYPRIFSFKDGRWSCFVLAKTTDQRWSHIDATRDREHMWGILGRHDGRKETTLDVVGSPDGGRSWKYVAKIEKPHHRAELVSFQPKPKGTGILQLRLSPDKCPEGMRPGYYNYKMYYRSGLTQRDPRFSNTPLPSNISCPMEKRNMSALMRDLEKE